MFFQGIFSENSAVMYGQYSRAGYDGARTVLSRKTTVVDDYFLVQVIQKSKLFRFQFDQFSMTKILLTIVEDLVMIYLLFLLKSKSKVGM